MFNLKLDAGDGIEPSVKAYETFVLPLHYPTKNVKQRYNHKKRLSSLFNNFKDILI